MTPRPVGQLHGTCKRLSSGAYETSFGLIKELSSFLVQDEAALDSPNKKNLELLLSP
jgi:hypothetical protein